MEPSTIALIVALVAVILFATEKLPIAVTSMLSLFVMVFTGVLTPGEAFASFGNTTVILLIGLMILAQSFFTTGLSDGIGSVLARSVGTDQKKAILVMGLGAVVMSMFINPVAVLAVLFTIIDSVSAKSNGTVLRKYTHLPVAIISTYSGQLTLIGTSSMLAASALLEKSFFGRPFTMFEPTLIAVWGIIIPFIFFLAGGQKLQEKWYDFPEIPALEAKTDTDKDGQTKLWPKWKMYTCVIVLLLIIIGIISKVANMGAIAMTGALVLIALGCITEKEAYAGVSWSTIFTLIGSLGLAEGLDKSGGGALVAEYIINLAGPLAQNAFLLAVIFLVIAVILSAFMSDTATVVICFPIAIAICESLSLNPLPVILAIARGANIATLAPISCAPMTMATVAGYRVKDVFRLGGIFTLGAMITTVIALYFIYFI